MYFSKLQQIYQFYVSYYITFSLQKIFLQSKVFVENASLSVITYLWFCIICYHGTMMNDISSYIIFLLACTSILRLNILFYTYTACSLVHLTGANSLHILSNLFLRLELCLYRWSFLGKFLAQKPSFCPYLVQIVFDINNDAQDILKCFYNLKLTKFKFVSEFQFWKLYKLLPLSLSTSEIRNFMESPTFAAGNFLVKDFFILSFVSPI